MKFLQTLSDLYEYRRESGMTAWILHRAFGVALILYLIPHVLVTGGMISAARTADPVAARQAFDEVYALVSGPFTAFLEILLVGMILFHALNGIRIILIDFFPSLVRRDLELDRITFRVWGASFALFAVLMLVTHLT